MPVFLPRLCDATPGRGKGIATRGCRFTGVHPGKSLSLAEDKTLNGMKFDLDCARAVDDVEIEVELLIETEVAV